MYEKKKTRWLRRGAALVMALWLTASLWVSTAAAEEQTRYLVPVGRAVGVKLFSDGVLVVSVVELEDGGAPARDAGVRVGDFLMKLNDQPLSSTERVQELLTENGGQDAVLTVQRNGRTMTLRCEPVPCTDGSYRIGAWIRDSMAGVGTLTYYDPASGSYGALGHGITDVDTRQLMTLSGGSIMDTGIKAVRRGEKGKAGELKGDFSTMHDVGTLTANTAGGIFGRVEEAESVIPSREALPVATRGEVHTGPVTILSTVSGTEVRAYDAEILRIFSGSRDTRDLLLRVTDPALLEATGGIVQGMSGSPILQDGRFVGAVTHVLLNDPTQGYGILMETMLSMTEV